jgi:outer membrane protein assembly factor BamA
VDAVAQAYGRRGRIAVKIAVEPSYDDETHTVRFQVRIAEGPEYRMGKVTFVTPSPVLSRALEERWLMKPGDVYDADYPTEFVHATRKAAPHLLAGFASVRSDVKPDAGKLTVDVSFVLGR